MILSIFLFLSIVTFVVVLKWFENEVSQEGEMLLYALFAFTIVLIILFGLFTILVRKNNNSILKTFGKPESLANAHYLFGLKKIFIDDKEQNATLIFCKEYLEVTIHEYPKPPKTVKISWQDIVSVELKENKLYLSLSEAKYFKLLILPYRKNISYLVKTFYASYVE